MDHLRVAECFKTFCVFAAQLITLVLLASLVFFPTQVDAQDSCPLYPIAIYENALEGAAPDDVFDRTPFSVGPGNFSQLTWTGDHE